MIISFTEIEKRIIFNLQNRPAHQFVPGNHLYMFHFVLIRDILITLLPQSGNRKGVPSLNPITSFFIAVAAGVTCHLICKWLDKR